MQKKQIILLFISILFISCTKTECIGFVYSKHGFLVPNSSIILYTSQTGKAYPSKKTVAFTNSDGLYFFKFEKKHNYIYWIKCESDSGNADGAYLRDSKSNAINIHIQ